MNHNTQHNYKQSIHVLRDVINALAGYGIQDIEVVKFDFRQSKVHKPGGVVDMSIIIDNCVLVHMLCSNGILETTCDKRTYAYHMGDNNDVSRAADFIASVYRLTVTRTHECHFTQLNKNQADKLNAFAMNILRAK